jgi:hypothetical protein
LPDRGIDDGMTQKKPNTEKGDDDSQRGWSVPALARLVSLDRDLLPQVLGHLGIVVVEGEGAGTTRVLML